MVEIDDDLLSRVRSWSLDRQKELYAIQVRLRGGGPEAMGLIKSGLEGVPAWRDLSGPVLQPDFRLVVVRLE